ncbi:hypothetical protein HX004_14125 [Myroides sp. 1354]|uniref:hypothetical protein n=1 Tax=unclassified Myroides TaxID=2642485 RepID=UPI002574F242|nr:MULTISPECIES: hypothetical protein [unclassified Myroides]MDM1045892.1 hypothetical protein [Myroides sp. R163-1]MDM1056902.1 hypothetical protein [Myroides sp. 1354]MDM1070097.1 hypothetical protein [Myroides sp. 1372]
MITIYKVKGLSIGLEFVFKYDLNGVLVAFEKNKLLNQAQVEWLYNGKIFPETEEKLHKVWIQDLDMRKKFKIEKAPADLSFESLWNLYGYKVSRQDAEKAFNKLNQIEVLKCFQALKAYEDYLARTKIAKAHLSRYINGRYFENEY